MNREIMALSNALVYEGGLQLAKDELKNKTIKLKENWKGIVPLSFRDVIDPSNPIVFISYDSIIHSLSKRYRDK